MKLSKKQAESKRLLNEICNEMGFEQLRRIVNLSGSSLGQYLAYDTYIVISETKLNLANAEYKLLCANNLLDI